MGKRAFAVLVTLVATGALAATTAVASTRASSSVSLRTTKVGKVLVAANGRTLYLFTADKGQSTCYGQCAAYWPPLIAQKPTAGAGLKPSLLGTTKRRDGKLQVTYGGHALYFFAQDKKASDVNGQGFVHFGGAWWVVSAAGNKVTVKP
jgi:predicted lipoprotein with Yx(FWY)xxD motif